MIQPNELRIDNIVSLKNGYNTKLPKYGKVTQVYMNGFTVDYHWPDEWFEPVELTHDILEAAGFKRLQNRNRYSKDELTNDIVFSNGFYISNVTPEIKYLHQLQNLYYCLTGEELQIDLTKLNK